VLQLGARAGVLSEHLILSAISRPYTGYYPKIWQKAAALVESMAGNHGYADGNKRTTLLLLHDLIRNSGYELVPLGDEDIEQAVGDVIVSAASGSASFKELETWFKPRIRRPASGTTA
jgi:death on curing protein